MGSQFLTIVYEMMTDPTIMNEPMPLANHKSTMFGVSIPFHVLSWTVVAIRLHTRLRVVREPGLDDLFVVLAAIVNSVALGGFLAGTRYGFGHHLIEIFQTLQQTMICLYITNAAYHTTTALIKVSLLCQYLRMFKEGRRRIVCIVLLVVISLWGIAFSFLTWFPCFPVSGFWNRTTIPPPRCYAFGYRTIQETKSVILAFAATNMMFDIAIFLVPLTEYFRPGLRKKEVLAMTGLFSLGSLVILMAVLRLWSAFKNSHSLTQSFDFTWWYPEVLIISCLEVDFAIMCASMPIFWPAVMASWSDIFVTKEVLVTHHQRLEESSEHFEMNRTHSIKSTASTDGLTKIASQEMKSFYNNFDAESGRGRSPGVTQIEVTRQERL